MSQALEDTFLGLWHHPRSLTVYYFAGKIAVGMCVPSSMASPLLTVQALCCFINPGICRSSTFPLQTCAGMC